MNQLSILVIETSCQKTHALFYVDCLLVSLRSQLSWYQQWGWRF